MNSNNRLIWGIPCLNGKIFFPRLMVFLNRGNKIHKYVFFASRLTGVLPKWMTGSFVRLLIFGLLPINKYLVLIKFKLSLLAKSRSSHDWFSIQYQVLDYQIISYPVVSSTKILTIVLFTIRIRVKIPLTSLFTGTDFTT